jgi:hypothetical protein
MELDDARLVFAAVVNIFLQDLNQNVNWQSPNPA